MFSSYTSGHPAAVELGNNNTATVAGKGTVTINIFVNEKKTKCVLKNVLHVPDLGYQLLSVPTFDKPGLNTSFFKRKRWVRKDSALLATATMRGNLYKLDVVQNPTEAALVARRAELWHRRLAHIQPATLLQMSKSQSIRGLQVSHKNTELTSCTGCILGKAHRSAIPTKSETRASKLLELVHSDVNGPIEVPSLGGSRYFVTFIDDFSRCTTLYTMKAKSETFASFKKFHIQAEKHTGSQIDKLNVIKRSNKSMDEIKALRTDNGGEYISNDFKSYFQQHGFCISLLLHTLLNRME